MGSGPIYYIMARLVRDQDGEGYSGSRVEARDEHGKVVGHEPMVGHSFLVGTITPAFPGDYWHATPITEILSETEEKIRFVTKNASVYTFYK